MEVLSISIALAILGAAIAIPLIVSSKNEAKRREAEKARKILDRINNILCKIEELNADYYGNLYISDDSGHFKCYGYDSVYNEIWSMKTELLSFKTKNYYLEAFNNLMATHKRKLNYDISNGLSEIKGKHCLDPNQKLRCILHKLKLLREASEIGSNYDSSINRIEEFLKSLNKPMYFFIQNKYGDFTLQLDNAEEMNRMNKIACKVEENLIDMLNLIDDNSDGYYCGIRKYMTESFLNLSAKLMWYYAKKEPFDVVKFRTARSIYETFTLGEWEHISETGTYRVKKETIKLEELLAIIYSKLMIGGPVIVQQQLKLIDSWIENHQFKDRDVEILASALSWMELYDLECHVLKKMVEKDMQMKPEVQKRLKFLLSGGTSNVTVYEIEKQRNFIFDSSSENWNISNEFSVFFRKVAMKNININYSLAISSWKKSLPLTSGQSVSMDDIYSEFQKMIKDFCGEVTCKRTTAQAIDLENVIYKDVALFSFTSERNKCLSILFACEKFGRTLNITIITLFTPEDGVDTETLQKYAVAIKSNIYVDSFRETILQSVDEVIKEEKNIYDDDVPSSSKKFVE